MSQTETDLKGSSSGAGSDGAPPASSPPEEAPPAISEVVTLQVVQSIVASHDADLELVDFSAEIGSQAGDNYMSVMYAVKINVKSKSTGSQDTLHIMLKTLPRNIARREMINEMMAFEKESKMYSQVFADFVNFQKEKGLEQDEIFSAYPICYSSFCDGMSDYLALQDLRISGFRMASRHDGLDTNHAKLVVRNLAKFHAISFAMFQGDYDRILEKYPFLKEKIFSKEPEEVDDMMKVYMSQTFISEGNSLRESGLEKEADLVQNVYNENFFSNMKKLVGDKVNWAVVGHGDCWTNNQLFSYSDETTNQVTAHKFLDFQLSRACSRTIDLHYFLYTSPKMEILNNDCEKLLRLYHDEFTSFAQKLGYVNEELTFENLVKEFEEFRDFGVIMGLMLAPIMGAAKQDVPDMETMAFDKNNFTQDAAAEFYSNFMKSTTLTKKLVNLAHNHIPKMKAAP